MVPGRDSAACSGECRLGVKVADGDGEGVGCVCGVGRVLQAQEALDHELDLILGGEAVADNGGLDGEWGVLGDGLAALGGGEERDATDLAELECGLGVGREEHLFNSDDVRAVHGDVGAELGVNVDEALADDVLFVEADGAGGDVHEARDAGVGIVLYNAVAGELGAAIDAEDTHGWSVYARTKDDHGFTRMDADQSSGDSILGAVTKQPRVRVRWMR